MMNQMGEIIQTENNLASTKKGTLPSPLNVLIQLSRQWHMHGHKGRNENPRAGREWGRLFQWQC